jgi:peroxiredoxin
VDFDANFSPFFPPDSSSEIIQIIRRFKGTISILKRQLFERTKQPKELIVQKVNSTKYESGMAIVLKSLLIAGIVSLSFSPAALHAQDTHPMMGEMAPLFELQCLDGKTYSLADSKGTFVVIHFATTWCPFCNAEAPHLEKLSQAYKDKGVQVIIVDVKEEKHLITKWSKRYNFSFPVLLDNDGSVSSRYAPEGVQPDLARDEVPLASNLIVDKEGKIRFYSLLNTASFDARLTKVKQTLDELLKADK